MVSASGKSVSIEAVLSDLQQADTARAAEDIVARHLANPAVDKLTLAHVLAQNLDSSPNVGSALVHICELLHLDALDYVSPDRIVEDATTYVWAQTRATAEAADVLRPGQWAWYLLEYGPLAKDVRWTLVLDVVKRAPDDEASLWLLGSGLLAALQMQGDGAKLTAAARSDPKLARALEIGQRP